MLVLKSKEEIIIAFYTYVSNLIDKDERKDLILKNYNYNEIVSIVLPKFSNDFSYQNRNFNFLLNLKDKLKTYRILLAKNMKGGYCFMFNKHNDFYLSITWDYEVIHKLSESDVLNYFKQSKDVNKIKFNI